MRMMLLLALFCLTSVGHAEAARPLDFSIHQEYVSTRALGMGNAFSAVTDDFSAIFYNPAMLAWRKEGHLRMFARGAASPEAIKLLDEIKKVQNLPQDKQAQGYSDLITSHYEDHFYYRIPTAGAVWARPGWGIALIPADLSLDAAVHRQVGPMLNVNLYQDTTLAISYAHELHWLPKSHKLSYGLTLKGIYRIYAGSSIAAPQFLTGASVFDKSNANEGMTVDADLGTSWVPPVPQSGFFRFLKYMQPSFAIVGRNLADYGFFSNYHFIDKKSGGEPPKLIRRVDFGSKFDLPKVWVFDPHISFDLRDVGHHNWSFKKGHHIGAELYWKMFNWWKGHWAVGINQGYWTAGFGARLAFFHLDLATYGEEVGTKSAPHESRRYMAEAALDF